jgi:hypothetical protein
MVYGTLDGAVMKSRTVSSDSSVPASATQMALIRSAGAPSCPCQGEALQAPDLRGPG